MLVPHISSQNLEFLSLTGSSSILNLPTRLDALVLVSQFVMSAVGSILARAGFSLFRRLRALALGWIPWSFTFFVYRIVRKFPRVYFAMRALIMGELTRPGR